MFNFPSYFCTSVDISVFIVISMIHEKQRRLLLTFSLWNLSPFPTASFFQFIQGGWTADIQGSSNSSSVLRTKKELLIFIPFVEKKKPGFICSRPCHFSLLGEACVILGHPFSPLSLLCPLCDSQSLEGANSLP